MSQNIESMVREVLEDFIEENLDELELDTDLKEFGVDSLMLFEIEEMLEAKFGIIVGEHSARLRTLRSTIELIQELQG